jgi:hypothetical protein
LKEVYAASEFAIFLYIYFMQVFNVTFLSSVVTLTSTLSLVPLKLAALSGAIVAVVSIVICSHTTPISAKILSSIAGPST